MSETVRQEFLEASRRYLCEAAGKFGGQATTAGEWRADESAASERSAGQPGARE